MSPALDCLPPRPRNKLRKLSKRRPESIVSNMTPKGSTDLARIDSSAEASGKVVPKSSPCPQRVSFSVPPDLSDPKWQAYVRKSDLLLHPMEQSPRLQYTKSPAPSNLIPEFAHLVVASTHSPTPSKKSFDESLPPPSPQSTLSNASSNMRRYAKTPVRRIGQLEEEASPTKLNHDSSNVELIAEQYRALLDRSYENFQPHTSLEETIDDWQAARTRQSTLATIRSAVSRRSPLPPLPPPTKAPPPPPLQPYTRQLTRPAPDLELEGSSPTSDGTLVDFEEDAAIYFKPSFSPEALSPIPEGDDHNNNRVLSPSPSPPPGLLRSSPPRPDALSLQITMELLSRELAGTLRRNCSNGSAGRRAMSPENAEIAPLQTWLMIEAYEKLRAVLLDMNLPLGEALAVRDMFDVWLSALYRVHDGLADDQDYLWQGDVCS